MQKIALAFLGLLFGTLATIETSFAYPRLNWRSADFEGRRLRSRLGKLRQRLKKEVRLFILSMDLGI